MENLKDMKKHYENVEIPEELSQVVEQAIRQGTEAERQKLRKAGRWSKARKAVAAAAALAVCFTAFSLGVNMSPSFASSIQDIPIIGNLAGLITVKQVEEETPAYEIKMAVPAVEGLGDATLEAQINKEIQDRMDYAALLAQTEAQAGRDWFISQGNDLADFRPMEITLDYRLLLADNEYLSFVLYQTQTSASYYEKQTYYNIRLADSQVMSLEDLLGDNWVEIASSQIREEIAMRAQNPDNIFFDGSEGVEGFSTVTEDTSFYINEAHNPVVVFNKYEIAPGFMGIQEFEIKQL